MIQGVWHFHKVEEHLKKYNYKKSECDTYCINSIYICTECHLLIHGFIITMLCVATLQCDYICMNVVTALYI